MDKLKPTADAGAFLVDCDAGQAGRFPASTASVWIKVGQRVQRHRAKET
jgi:hypothetical protein